MKPAFGSIFGHFGPNSLLENGCVLAFFLTAALSKSSIGKAKSNYNNFYWYHNFYFYLMCFTKALQLSLQTLVRVEQRVQTQLAVTTPNKNSTKGTASGGGGTFVVRDNKPLIIAGGGGGIAKMTEQHSGCDASINTSENAGYNSPFLSGGMDGDGEQTDTDKGEEFLFYKY